MNTSALPLRTVLMLLILTPLVIISAIGGYWRYTVAKETAKQIFDRTLIALTIAISRDVANSGGDALSPSTNQIMREASGGRVYYHVYGPDGSFVTGYATPPLPPRGTDLTGELPVLYQSSYRGEDMRVARLREHVTIDTISGYSAVTVWQALAGREAFARQLALRAAALIGLLFLTVAAVVWFGVHLGLKPLLNLEDAIASRTSDDLSVIRRPVPDEVKGIVATLNGLFRQVSDAMASRDRFISDAAHQLRNPMAGMLALAEAAGAAESYEDQKTRVRELAQATRHAARLTNQLLSLERAKGRTDRSHFVRLKLNRLVRGVCERHAEAILERGIDLSFDEAPVPIEVNCDEVLLQEAVDNLINNALTHGGPDNREITVRVRERDGNAVISVMDGGKGLRQADSEIAFSRFSQISPGEGSGLGLPIVMEIASLHGGTAKIEPSDTGAVVSIIIPLDEMSQAPGVSER